MPGMERDAQKKTRLARNGSGRGLKVNGTVTIQASAELVEAIWQSLSLERKADLLKAL